MSRSSLIISFLVTSFFFITITDLSAAEITYEIKPDRIDFLLTFDKDYSNLNIVKSSDSFVLNFETPEPIVFKRQDFFDLPVESAYIISTDTKKRFIIKYSSEFIEPVVNNIAKQITLIIPFPPSYIATQLDQQAQLTPDDDTKIDPLPTTAAYLRMLFGLGIVLFIILLAYYLLRRYFKKQVFTDIPGTGRLLGKVDLDLRKSLYFYELGDIIYIIGVTDSNISLIDKITSEEESTKIRTGLRAKHDFKGYLTFFRRKDNIDDNINTSNTLVEEKLQSLRKKR